VNRIYDLSHDGEIWLAWNTARGLVLAEQSAQVDGELLGEIRTRVIDGDYVHDIVPVQERDAVELALRARQTEEHNAYRARLYRQYPIEGKRLVTTVWTE
jgi:hypothetical protein